MNYQETVDFLYSRLPMFQRMGGAALKKDLSNTKAILEKIGNPHKKSRFVHVAGTNGKGSTASMLAAIFTAAGYKTGLYTSPHLKSFQERIRINGIPIEESAVVQYVDKYKVFLDDYQPSFFELTTAMAFDHFARQEVDVAIIEVGLGGRLDSTNVISPLLSIITQIGMDHQQFLGNTLEAITTEKAGIIKEGVPVVCGIKEENLRAIVQQIADCKDALYADALLDNQIALKEGGFDYSLENETILIQPELNASYQIQNIRTVLKACDIINHQSHFNLSPSAIKEGLENTITLSGLKGRWQRFILDGGIKAIADTGHNELAVKELVSMLRQEEYDRLHIVWGMVADKDAFPVLNLLPKDALYYFTQANIPRALNVAELHQKAGSIGLKGKKYTEVNLAIEQAKAKASKDDLIFIGGSTFVVAEISEL